MENTKNFSIVLTLDAGQVLLDSSNVKQFYFIEDIFSYSITGKLIFLDDKGIFEFGPLTGNETVSVVYGNDEDIEKSFYIYKLSRVDQHSQTSPSTENIIELFFVDFMFFSLNFLQYSKAWKDEKISNIIRYIGNEWLNIEKWKQFEESNEKLDYYYSPYWNPKTNISWLLKRASGSKSGQSGYLLYNTIEGTNFITLEKMLNGEILKVNDEDSGLYNFEDENLFLYNKILSWNISGLDSIGLKSISGGTRLGFNDDKKSFVKEQYTYKESVENNTILGSKTLFPDYSESQTEYINSGDSEYLDNIFNNAWVKKYSLQQCLGVVVKGHENRVPGKLIEIQWKSKNPNEIYNKNLSGYYLVKSITHTFSGFNNPVYSQKMVLIKNGYEDSDARNLLNSVKKKKV